MKLVAGNIGSAWRDVDDGKPNMECGGAPPLLQGEASLAAANPGTTQSRKRSFHHV